ncbi:MAG: mechanosensitive ion channel family protein [Bacteroidetes bacterium]|nr:mechanosensitive ion channel family protein [Bacteroidota bacterium]
MNIDKFYDHVYDWVLRFGPKFLVGLVVLFVGLWLISMLMRWSRSGMQKRKLDASVKSFILSLIAVSLRVLLILSVMQIMGIKMTLFTALVGAFGVAAGLALSGTLQNFASGVLILLLKPFKVGENITTAGMEGTVTSIQIFYTIVETFDNRVLIVPNGQLSNQMIINTSRKGTRRLDINLKFPNNIDVKQVKSVIEKSLDESKHCLKSPEKRVGMGEIQPDGYMMAISVWVNAHGFQDTKLEVQETLFEDIKHSGIKIPGL